MREKKLSGETASPGFRPQFLEILKSRQLGKIEIVIEMAESGSALQLSAASLIGIMGSNAPQHLREFCAKQPLEAGRLPTIFAHWLFDGRTILYIDPSVRVR